MVRFLVVGFFGVISLGIGGLASGQAPVISEFVAVGNTTYLDEDLDAPDWIEIYNPTGVAIDLAGYYLTDDVTNLIKWTFPSKTLAAYSYLVVFASDKNRVVAGAPLHTNFKLTAEGEYLALVGPDGTTVLSEFTPTFPGQVEGYSYGLNSVGTKGYLSPPTPGAVNGALVQPLLAPILTPASKSFTTSTSVTITLTAPIAGSVIRYTTDGTAPTTTSTAYTGSALTFSSTTHLRARVFSSSGAPGTIAGGHYQKLATVTDLVGINSPGTFTSNVPIMVVENFGAGTIPGGIDPLQTARLLIFDVDPVTGRSSLSGTPSSSLRIGIRKRGATSENFAKPPYKVEVRDEMDADSDFALLGLPSESDWVFGSPYVDKALIRNSLVFDLGRDIGMEAPKTKHFEMFVSTNGGDVLSSEYVGVYVLQESIKQGKNRVDVTEMTPTDNSAPEVTGGYVFRFEADNIPLPLTSAQLATGWNTAEFVEPDPPTTAQKDYLGQYLNSFMATLGWTRGVANDTGVVNNDPLTGYPAYIDVDSFVHLLTINELVRDQDSYVRSDYMYKDRGGKIHKGPLWDYDLSMGTGILAFNSREVGGWQLYGSAANLVPYIYNYNRGGREPYNGGADSDYEMDMFVPLLRDANFRQQWIDQWFGLRRYGALENTALTARIDAHANPLAEAGPRNFIKWSTLLAMGKITGTGFYTTSSTTWAEQIDAVKTWLGSRISWLDARFPSPVVFSPASTAVTAGTPIALTASLSSALSTASGVIYYTTDGTDPRLPGGGVSPSASMIASGGTVTVNASKTVIARTRFDNWTMSPGTWGVTWSAPTLMTYVVGTPASATNLALTELNYHPASPSTPAELADPTFRNDDFEFIEVKNISSGPIDLSGIAFVDGVTLIVPAIKILAAGAYGVFVESQAAFQARYGTGSQILGVYADKLSNDGEALRLIDLYGNDIFNFTFNDIWYPLADGAGSSLVVINPSNLSASASWIVSNSLLGTPGLAEGSVFYNGWMYEQFTAAERADPLTSGALADPEGDGITNLMEFALGLNPNQNDPQNLPDGNWINTGGNDYLSLSFRRQKQPYGLIYRVQASNNMQSWTEVSTVVGTPLDNGNGIETVTIRDSQPFSAATERFMRLKVEKTTP